MGLAERYDNAETAAALAGFYALHGDLDTDPYLARKAVSISSRRELADAYGKIRFALGNAGTVLDWGCRHGVFGWLARRDLGNAAGLWGCDVCTPEQYAHFHAASGLQYVALTHPWQLPYADASFDAVLAGGTLEHVPNDGESLTELWRVLKPGGRLALTHLPNATSISEWLSRTFSPQQAHPRRYHLITLRQRLLHMGFMPLRWGYHQWLPAAPPNADSQPRLMQALERSYGLNHLLERVWPLNRFSTTLWLVVEKRMGF